MFKAEIEKTDDLPSSLNKLLAAYDGVCDYFTNGNKGTYTIECKVKRAKRSNQQLRLFMWWVDLICEHTGDSKEFLILWAMREAGQGEWIERMMPTEDGKLARCVMFVRKSMSDAGDMSTIDFMACMKQLELVAAMEGMKLPTLEDLE